MALSRLIAMSPPSPHAPPKPPLRVAILGTRGIPARYGGFETFAEELSVRLVQRGHAVTVYGRAHFYPERPRAWRGVRVVILPTLHTKYLETVAHTFLSALHVMLQPIDVVLICNGINSPFCALPRLCGKKVLINIDGLEWQRQKWSWLGRLAHRAGARLSTWLPHGIIADARFIQDFYRDELGVASTFIPYGSRTLSEPHRDTGILERLGLARHGYVLYVSRLEPENNAHVVIDAFERVRTDKKLLIVGYAPYGDAYVRALRDTRDPRILFPGAIYGADYLHLLRQCHLYVQAGEVGGTHPALLEGMGAGKCVLYNDVPEHVEVLGEGGVPFRGAADLAEKLQHCLDHPHVAAAFGRRARRIAAARYDWDDVTTSYERCFYALLGHGAAVPALQPKPVQGQGGVA